MQGQVWGDLESCVWSPGWFKCGVIKSHVCGHLGGSNVGSFRVMWGVFCGQVGLNLDLKGKYKKILFFKRTFDYAHIKYTTSRVNSIKLTLKLAHKT